MGLNSSLKVGITIAIIGAIITALGLFWASTAFDGFFDSVDSVDCDTNELTVIECDKKGDFGFLACFGGLGIAAIGGWALVASLIPIIGGGMQVVTNDVDDRVVVECPHCGVDIQLSSDASGLFECPECNQEFEWN